MRRLRQLGLLASGLLGVGAVGVLIGLSVQSCTEAERSATSFTTALREGRLEEASALVTPALRPDVLDLAHSPDPWRGNDRVRMLRLIRESKRVEETDGYRGNFRELCARVALIGDRGTTAASAWWVLRKIDGHWLVDDMGIAAPEPEICTPEPP